LFVCERSLSDPLCVIREHEIGTTVFGRSEDFLAGEDTLVRVHASRLRKRLDLYFSTEGSAEPTVIDIPKHTYVPVFRPRGVRAPPAEAADADRSGAPDRAAAASAARRDRRLVALACAAVVLLLCAAGLYVDDRALRRRLDAPLEPAPTV